MIFSIKANFEKRKNQLFFNCNWFLLILHYITLSVRQMYLKKKNWTKMGDLSR